MPGAQPSPRTPEIQRAALAGYGVPAGRVYVDEGFTGTSTGRPGLDQAFAAVHSGDTLIVPRLDRFARSVPGGVPSQTSSSAAEPACRSVPPWTNRPTRSARCSSTSSPRSPSSRWTSSGSARSRAWPGPASAESSRASSPSSTASSGHTCSSSTGRQEDSDRASGAVRGVAGHHLPGTEEGTGGRRMTAQPAGPAPVPDTGSYEVIHLGGQAAVVVPVAGFLRLRLGLTR